MSTRSRIGVLSADGTVTSVYCHYDGYPEGVGKKLLAGHNSEDAANVIVALGDLSSVARDGTVIAYTRDRGEAAEGNKAKTHPVDHWPDSDMRYAYLWRDGGWLVAANKSLSTFMPIPEMIAKELVSQ